MSYRALFVLMLTASAWSETVTIDAGAGRHPIDPRIYGVAYANAATLSDLNCPLNRHGGNSTTCHNWQANADNRGMDWYFESISLGSATPGESADNFIQGSRNGGAEPMITIPMIGWVAKVGSNRQKLCSFSQAKYGAQSDADWSWFADAGNGIRASNGALIAGNDPNDAHVPADAAFQKNWVEHLVQRWGSARNGGVRYYILDNEHGLWHETHRSVHPTGATMDEIRQKMISYATMIKSVDRDAVIVGPEEWGWLGYMFSGYDMQYRKLHGWSNAPDRANHGGVDYLPWLLAQIKAASDAAGMRLLDLFTVHYYPQGGEFSNDTSNSMQLRRNRSTRSLWDPNYVDETWINERINLLPRLKGWVASSYPGTPIGITEYNWGAEGHVNGATAQADVLGIFGREGLDVATRWTTPAASTPTYKAMKLYRNYDGLKSTFGDVSVAAYVTNPDNLSAFAALRSSDGAMTVMAINKAFSETPLSLALSRFSAGGKAQAWRLDQNNQIVRVADVDIVDELLSTSVPAQSITLFIIPQRPTNTAPTVTAAAAASPNPVFGASTTLTALGADDGGEAGLTYLWSVISGDASAVTFGGNGTNAAKSISAAFRAAGIYGIRVVIRDAAGLFVTSSATITVSQRLTSLSLSPASVTVAAGGTQPFSASARDQFGASMTLPPIIWTVSGGGTISASGLFTAAQAVGGPFVVTADGNGVRATASVQVAANPGNGTGLTGQYFDNGNFTAPALTRTDATVDFNWGTGSPSSAIGADTFSARWTGQVQAMTSEPHTFSIVADDGVRLWIGSQLVIDRWIDQSPTTCSGTIALAAGQKYRITLEYYENGGGAVCRLLWSTPSRALTVIPKLQLYADVVAPKNLVLNPGFEAGVASWQDWGNSAAIANAGISGFGLRVGTGAGGRGQTLIGLKPGATYSLSGWGCVGSATERGWIGVDVSDPSGNRTPYVIEFNTRSYAQKSRTFTVPLNAGAARIWVWKDAGSSHLFIDALSVIEQQ